MQGRINKLRTDAQDEYENARARGYRFLKFTLVSFVNVYRSNGTLLSFDERMEFYENGAHPFPDSEFYNVVDSVPARRLTLPDLFTDPDAGVKSIKKLVGAAIASDPGDYFEGAQIDIDKKTWFYLTDSELHIVFPAYSVAPGAAGEPDLGFKLEQFRDRMIPEAK